MLAQGKDDNEEARNLCRRYVVAENLGDNVKLAPFVYNRVHTVSELVNNRAFITYDGVVVAAVNVDDLVLA